VYKPEEFSPAVALDKSAGLLGIFLVLLSIAVYFFLAGMNHSSTKEQWILFVKINDRSSFPIFKPEIPWYLAIMLVGLAVTLAP
jgi:hypothetical protein